MTIILTYQPLPSHVPALVHANCDDSYTIIVNNNLSDASKKDAIRHEVCHIMGNDFFKEDIDSIEHLVISIALTVKLGKIWIFTSSRRL